MVEWILRIIGALFGRESAAQQRREAIHESRETHARENFDSLTHAYNDLMANYMKMNQELRQDLENLRNEVVSLAAELERERTEHKECRRELSILRAEMDTIKGQVAVLRQHQTDIDHAGS